MVSHPQTFPVGLFSHPKLPSRAFSALLSHLPGSTTASSSPGGIWLTGLPQGLFPLGTGPTTFHPFLSHQPPRLRYAKISRLERAPHHLPVLCLAQSPTQSNFSKMAGGINAQSLLNYQRFLYPVGIQKPSVPPSPTPDPPLSLSRPKSRLSF